MKTIERIGGWLLLAGGMVYLIDMVTPALKSFDSFARMAVAAGAAAWIAGQVIK